MPPDPIPGRYYLVSDHDTVLHIDFAAGQLRHQRFGTAPLNLFLDVANLGVHLVMRPDPALAPQILMFARGADGSGETPTVEYQIEFLDRQTIAIRIGEQYLSASPTGGIEDDRVECREWERFRLVRQETADSLLFLQRYSWLCHSDRKVYSLSDSGGMSLRRDVSLGPALISLAPEFQPFVWRTPPENFEVAPFRFALIHPHGNVSEFSLFRPLIYYCVFGHDSYFDCLKISLDSLVAHGKFSGTLGIACDRRREDILKYIPERFHENLIVSEATRTRGWFNQYYLDHGFYDAFQPILYSDIDIIYDLNIKNLLVDIILSERICCANENQDFLILTQKSPHAWGNSAIEHFFGKYLYAADIDFYDRRVALGNAGLVGFDNIDRSRWINELVKRIAARQPPDRLRNFSDQPILDYVLHKTGLGDFEILNRYCRLTRRIEGVPARERRGLVHFHGVAGGKEDASEKAAIMRLYADQMAGVATDPEAGREIELNLGLPGQMAVSELERLGYLARRVPAGGCIVEIGSLFGLSSWTLGKNADPTVSVHCIDPWVREPWMLPVEQSFGQILSIETFKNNVSGIPNIIALQGYSPRDFQSWKQPVDLVFEDSVHTNPILRENLKFWTPFVRSQGIICGHDYSDDWPDVKSEVDNLAASLGAAITVVGTLWSLVVP
jgi:hypothetical protein